MSPLRHAAAWLAAVAAGAAFTAALVPPSALDPLALRWQAQLVGWSGHAEAVRSRADALAARMPALLALRLSTLCAWLWLLLPLWLAASLQGWAIADARRAAFAAANPSLHRLAGHGAVAAGGGTLLALSLPLDLPVAVVPAGGVLVALLLAARFAHRPAWRG
ncbi:MAG: hypothetical protein ACK515_00165 [bacterium]|jgi:hypothetical protein|nr:hypothetical protein [Betaproteobacteria bacterium]